MTIDDFMHDEMAEALWSRFSEQAAARATSMDAIAGKIRWLQWAHDRGCDAAVAEMIESLAADLDAMGKRDRAA
jgi:hypothetical protein